MEKYSIELEKMMFNYYSSLQEREKRHYAALEVLKLGFGGQKYICELFAIDKNTVRKGVSELSSWENASLALGKRQRKVGGGRKKFFLPKK